MPKPAQNVNSPKFETLPHDWELTRFDSVALVTDYVANGSFASLKANVKYKNEPDYAVLVRFTDFTKKWEKSFKYVDKHAYDFLGKSSLLPGDVVIANVGDPGRVFRVPNLGQPMTLGPNSVLVRGHEGVDNSFLSYFFMSPWGQDLIAKITTGTAQKKFNKTGLRSLIIPVASLEQQKRIVAEIEKQFSRLDEAVTNLNSVKVNLKRYKAAVLKAAVEGKLTEEWRKQHPEVEPASKLLERILAERRQKWEEAELAKMKAKGKAPKDDKWKKRYKEPSPPDISELPELPEGWVWSNFETAADRVTVGHVGSMKNEYIDQGIPFLRSQNVRANRYDPRGLKFISKEFHNNLNKSTLHPGDIVVVRSGSVGVTCVIPKKLPEANCSDLVIIRTPRGVLSHYGAYYMNSIVETRVAAGKVGVALTHFNTKSVARLPLPVPPIAEQEFIVAEVESRLSRISETEVQLEIGFKRAERLRQSILSKAFSGQLVQPEPDDEPASVLLDRIRKEMALQPTPQKTRKALPGKRRQTVKSSAATKRTLIEVLKEHPDGISPESLLLFANYTFDEIDCFYAELVKIGDKISEEKPTGKDALAWPHENKVLLRLRSE